MNKGNYALIFAGGSGTRMNSNSIPKQFLKLYGKEIIIYTLENFQNHPQIDGIVISCKEDWIDYLNSIIESYRITKVKAVVAGGPTGQESIFNGLKALKEIVSDDSVILINDGVRPVISSGLISDCIKCTRENGSAIACSQATETIIRSTSSEVSDILDRSECCYARAPQCFHLGEIYRAAEESIRLNKSYIDCASLMKDAGKKLFTVSSSSDNIKITTPSDFYIFKALYDAGENRSIFGL